MSFSRFVFQKDAKIAVILNLIDPGMGGVLLAGKRGTGKSTLARAATRLLGRGVPCVQVPLNATEDALLGSVDIEEAVRTGKKVTAPGLLTRAAGGVLYIDDVNLMSPELLHLILDAQSRPPTSELQSVPRSCHPFAFVLIASMNHEEGSLSAHVMDRFGLCAVFDGTVDQGARLRILKRNTSTADRDSKFFAPDRNLGRRILEARSLLGRVEISDEMRARIANLCLEAGIAGHRGDITLQRAAAAWAAARGDMRVGEEHISRALPLVLIHRTRKPSAFHPPGSPENNTPDHNGQDTQDEQKPPQDIRPPGEQPEDEKGSSGDESPLISESRQGQSREEVFPVGEPFKPRRFILKKDRMERQASGRRTKTKFSGKGGRYVKSVLKRRDNDVAVDATLRAAAPWQKWRGRRTNLIIEKEDLRYRQRERTMGHLVIFVLDCSGSMGVKKRMIETKGAVMSLLVDCYHKKDKVSVIAFRKNAADLVLPPTSSVQLASRLLQDLPAGGKTPLAAALLTTYQLIRQTAARNPHARCLAIVITDGRANQALSNLPVREEIANCARELARLGNADYVVLDTEDKSGFMRADLASDLALMLEADYFTTDDLKAEYLTQIAQRAKHQAG